MEIKIKEQGYPSGHQCLWCVSPESQVFTPPHQGSADLKGPFLPGHEVHLSQRAGIPAKAE